MMKAMTVPLSLALRMRDLSLFAGVHHTSKKDRND
jgi:hypothetical protein